jgi:hypothetical protein
MLNRQRSTSAGATQRTLWALPVALALLGFGAYRVYADDERGEPPEVAAPSITLKPAKLTRQRSARFRFTDRESGITFQCSLDRSLLKACASPKLYRGLLAGGRHLFRVRATRSIGETELSAVVSYTWSVRLRPPKPHIVRHPRRSSGSSTAVFSFVDRERGVRFRCRLDARRWRRCARRVTYRRLGRGRHRLLVRAVDRSKILSLPTRFRWRIVQRNGMRFSITARPIDGSLYPGAVALRIPITLTNPNSVSIYVTSLTAAVASSPVGCDSATNISLGPSSASRVNSVRIRPHGSVTLPSQGVAGPTIEMVDRPVNQDACRNDAFALSFSGSAHS